MLGRKGCLFEGFQRGLFREGSLATAAGHEIDGLADGHGGAEIQAHAPMVAGGARNFPESIGDIRLRAEIELHVGIDRETVKALLADAAPFPVRLHKPLIDAEAGPLTDGAFHGCQSGFDFLNRRCRHRAPPCGRV
jgi:hypothetical protein